LERALDDVRGGNFNPDGTLEGDSSENLFFGASFAEVEKGSSERLGEHADRALFLCWPRSPAEVKHRDEAEKIPWDKLCLDHWHGDTLIHVGEWVRAEYRARCLFDDAEGRGDPNVSGSVSETFPRGTVLRDHPAGVTTSRQFQDAVEERFELQKIVRLPNWLNARDDLTVWTRKR
jgi:hypothetical protein